MEYRDEDLFPAWRREDGKRKYGYIDRKGNVVVSAFVAYASEFHEGLAVAAVERGQDDRWGYVDKSGRWAIEPRFAAASPFNSGRASVMVDDRWCLIDATGRFVVPPGTYKDVSGVSDGLCRFSIETQDKPRYGFLDPDGNVAISPRFLHASQFFDGVCMVAPEKGKCGAINTSGEFVIEPKYYALDDSSEGLIKAQPGRECKVGFLDQSGAWVIQPSFEDPRDCTQRISVSCFQQGLCAVNSEAGCGFIDHSGAYVIGPMKEILIEPGTHPVALRKFYDFFCGRALFSAMMPCGEECEEDERTELVGFLDKEGKVVVPPMFATADGYTNGLALVDLDWVNQAYIDMDGNPVWASGKPGEGLDELLADQE